MHPGVDVKTTHASKEKSPSVLDEGGSSLSIVGFNLELKIVTHSEISFVESTGGK